MQAKIEQQSSGWSVSPVSKILCLLVHLCNWRPWKAIKPVKSYQIISHPQFWGYLTLTFWQIQWWKIEFYLWYTTYYKIVESTALLAALAEFQSFHDCVVLPFFRSLLVALCLHWNILYIYVILLVVAETTGQAQHDAFVCYALHAFYMHFTHIFHAHYT